ncbi:hypothetical protein QCA50_010841 [Cerrena zonata]|uniref:Uncharacterized protein n=1 Tax=Cerrena zonata TaxID=2478898 RepID=A0AAW0G4E0_9APHY
MHDPLLAALSRLQINDKKTKKTREKRRRSLPSPKEELIPGLVPPSIKVVHRATKVKRESLPPSGDEDEPMETRPNSRLAGQFWDLDL